MEITINCVDHAMLNGLLEYLQSIIIFHEVNIPSY